MNQTTIGGPEEQIVSMFDDDDEWEMSGLEEEVFDVLREELLMELNERDLPRLL